MSVEDQITALRLANSEENWEIPEEVFNRLAETAPAWPEGRLMFRSLRIRFGEGDEGVQKTLEAHVKRIETVFGAWAFWRWGFLLSGKDRLRLLNSNDTHKLTVEWVTIDLNANRERESITSVRGPQSLADELLTFVWLFPEYVRQIDYKDNPALFAAGYELNVFEDVGEPWQSVPCVCWDRDDALVGLCAFWRDDDLSCYSVPIFRE